jgi:sorbitol-specific phosphotransferase system component IIA
MDRIEKLKTLSGTPINPEEDIALINQYAHKELTPEGVFCFPVHLCDNDVDRDLERFTEASLEKLAQLFVGKSGILDHNWSAEKQVARLYRCEVEQTSQKNTLGEPLIVLRGSAYMIRNEANQPLIEAIEGGIVKEVSVGCNMGKCTCSICGKDQKLDWRTWQYQCEDGHIRGEKYDGKLCFGELGDPKDAYEFSFVAVPAQRKAGVTKGLENLDEAVEVFKAADIGKVNPDDLKEIGRKIQLALAGEAERLERAKILVENQKFMEVKQYDTF